MTIVECWTEHQGVRNLVQFLQPHDIGASFAVRIYKHYGPQALSIVQENPYRLAMDIRGIGFLTADALAAKLGFESEHPLRIQAGTLYTLMKQIDDGHVYYPRRALVNRPVPSSASRKSSSRRPWTASPVRNGWCWRNSTTRSACT